MFIEIRLGQGSGEFRESLALENLPMIPILFNRDNNMEEEKIIIIEDDEDTKLYLKFFIGKKFQIDLFTSDEFYSKHNESSFGDLIILDLSIKNKIDGEQIITKIRSSVLYKSIPLICISAQRSEQERGKVIALGADEFLLKPVANDKLLKVIKELLTIKKESGN